MRHRAGFTILELSVVIALMALMAGVVTVSMNNRLRGVHEDQALAAIKALDHRARHEGRSGSGAAAIQLDTRAGNIQIEKEHNNQDITLDEYVLPAGLQMDNTWLLLNGRRVERKTLPIPVEADGSSPTYGFTIRGIDEDGNTITTAMLVAGVSGQFTVFDNEDDVQDILETIARHDAD